MARAQHMAHAQRPRRPGPATRMQACLPGRRAARTAAAMTLNELSALMRRPSMNSSSPVRCAGLMVMSPVQLTTPSRRPNLSMAAPSAFFTCRNGRFESGPRKEGKGSECKRSAHACSAQHAAPRTMPHLAVVNGQAAVTCTPLERTPHQMCTCSAVVLHTCAHK